MEWSCSIDMSKIYSRVNYVYDLECYLGKTETTFHTSDGIVILRFSLISTLILYGMN